jgi:hypothetical protein
MIISKDILLQAIIIISLQRFGSYACPQINVYVGVGGIGHTLESNIEG